MSILKKWADHFHKFGFSLVSLGNGGDPKRPFQAWKGWTDNPQSSEELAKINFDAPQVTGIGGITGTNNIVCLDFDKVSNNVIIYKFLQLIGLDADYAWTVVSGSKKGYHIWFKCKTDPFSALFKGGKQVYTFNAKKDEKDFHHIEYRLKQHTVLPPSIHPSGDRYEWLNENPASDMEYIDGEVLKKALLEFADPLLPKNGNGKAKRKPNKKKVDIPDGGETLSKLIEGNFDLVGYAVEHLPGGSIQEVMSNGEIRVGESGAGYGTILIDQSTGKWNHPQSGFFGGGWPQMVAYGMTKEVNGYKDQDFPEYIKIAADFIGIPEEKQIELKKAEKDAWVIHQKADKKTEIVKKESDTEDLGLASTMTKRGARISRFQEFVSSQHTIIRNEITNQYEIDGRPLNDEDENTLYIQAHQIGIDISKDDARSAIRSDFVEAYNPLKEFFESRKDMDNKPTGLIRELVNSMEIEPFPKYEFYMFFRKWMIGAVAGIWPEHKNILNLVLCGTQNEGKSHFFEYLIPPSLRDYFIVNQLDKDPERYLCMFWLICDDEYSGKSKKESDRLKFLQSQRNFTFRVPYDRNPITKPRIATLCGTSNDNEVLSDTTGNRRNIAVNVISRDFDKYDAIDKDMIWMEAYFALISGESYQLTRAEITLLENHSKTFERFSIEYELIQKYIELDESEYDPNLMSSTEIMMYICNQSGVNRVSKVQIGKELIRLGYTQSQVRRNGKFGRYYNAKTVIIGLPNSTPF